MLISDKHFVSHNNFGHKEQAQIWEIAIIFEFKYHMKYKQDKKVSVCD